MCVIVYKPAGIEFPDETLLANCFDVNSDGAGYMYAHKGKVYIRKGLMTYKGFRDSLDDLDPRVDRTKSPFVFHFRISTQAGIRKDCCHPYPLSRKMDDLRKLKAESEFGVAHNGTISLTSEYGYKGKAPTYNDTMKFITDYLSLIVQDRHYYKNRDTITLIERLAESKLAILDGAGHCELIGKFVEHEGCFYSNDSYKGRTKKYASYTRPYSCAGWNDYDYIYGSNKTTHKWFDEQEIDYWYDDRTGFYYFDDYNCPANVDDDPTYCEHCTSRVVCEGAKPVPVFEPIHIKKPKKTKKSDKLDAEAKKIADELAKGVI